MFPKRGKKLYHGELISYVLARTLAVRQSQCFAAGVR